eukprot:gene15438-18311_t
MAYVIPSLYGCPYDFSVLTSRMFAEMVSDQYFLITQLRLLDRYFTGLNAKVDAMSPRDRDAQEVILSRNVNILHSWETADLTPSERLGYRVMRGHLETLLEGHKKMIYPAPMYYIHPTLYSVNQLSGAHLALLEVLNIQQINNVKDAERYIARVVNSRSYIDGLIADLEARGKLNMVPPKFVLMASITQINTKVLLAQHHDNDDSEEVEDQDEVEGQEEEEKEEEEGGADNYDSEEQEDEDQDYDDDQDKDEKFFVTSKFERDMFRLLDSCEISRNDSDRLMKELASAIETYMVPAYHDLSDFLTDQMIGASQDDGAWKINPNNDDIYEYLLRYHTTTTMSPKSIHELGLREVSRIKEEIITLLGSEYPHLSTTLYFGEYLRDICAEPRFAYTPDDQGRDAILDEYAYIIYEASQQLDDLFETIPDSKCCVERVPFFREENAAMGQYIPAPLDRSRRGTFYVNLRDTTSHTKVNMKDLAYHEATPGHHLQISTAQELKDIDIFRRLIVFNAYAEGWALYAERLADEAGWYQNKYERLGFLMYELWRAVRLVVDTGIHASAYRWTRNEAIDYMIENTGLPNTDIEAEVERYIVLPGQACSYKIGQIKILELRELARNRLGSHFVLKQFHTAVLGSGALPLDLLEEVVEDWIVSKEIEYNLVVPE